MKNIIWYIVTYLYIFIARILWHLTTVINQCWIAILFGKPKETPFKVWPDMDSDSINHPKIGVVSLGLPHSYDNPQYTKGRLRTPNWSSTGAQPLLSALLGHILKGQINLASAKWRLGGWSNTEHIRSWASENITCVTMLYIYIYIHTIDIMMNICQKCIYIYMQIYIYMHIHIYIYAYYILYNHVDGPCLYWFWCQISKSCY